MKVYLGDSVYVYGKMHEGFIILTTENGLPTDPSNTIVLETAVLVALVSFAKRCGMKII